MRLSTDQINAYRQFAQKSFGDGGWVSIFGFMSHVERREGDIELIIETNQPLENNTDILCKLTGSITPALCDRKICVFLNDAKGDLLQREAIAQTGSFALIAYESRHPSQRRLSSQELTLGRFGEY